MERYDRQFDDCLYAIVAMRYKQLPATIPTLSAYLHKPKAIIKLNVDKLYSRSLVTFGSGDQILLTETGAELAEALYTRRQLLEELLTKIGVRAQTAVADAARIEHAMTEETYRALVQYLLAHPM